VLIEELPDPRQTEGESLWGQVRNAWATFRSAH
jgi:hypothetical protein